ncbi:MAG: N-acetylmuramic acid 6-phosphate etherase [Firmicutes bacterium]|jgi:N-acetylmuramic acid 6-phosphate etherase|nr:N-acetylmuramic acid 6-phosphate etherase [Bacillota bacterium]
MEPPAGTNDLTTEKRNKNSLELDTMTTQEILTLINAEDQKVAPAVAAAIPQITQAVDLIAGRLKAGGRLFYVGAGTSGRLGILDVAEVRPTFGIGLDTVEAIIAGGARAITEAVEEAEDDFDQGGRELRLRNISEVDAVVGIAASGSTPFVLGALLTAREAGAAAIGIACNHNSRLRDYADIAIEVVVGPEILTGSTRMKAGTAQKMVLNMISTAVMVNLGQVYENLMVGMQITNTKLVQRAIRMVAAAAEVTVDDAAALLEASQRDIKLAIVMGKLQADAATARQLLENAQGYVRKAVTLGLEKKD